MGSDDILEVFRPEMAPLLDEFNSMSPILSRRDRVLVWLDKIMADLGASIQGDITRDLPTRIERRQCFITADDGTVRYLNEWVEDEVLENPEDQPFVPKVPWGGFRQFMLGLLVLKHDTKGKTVIANGKEESVVEVGPVFRCAAAYARLSRKKGKRARTEKALPEKWVAFRDLAAHLGIVSQKVDPESIKRTVLRAKARLK